MQKKGKEHNTTTIVLDSIINLSVAEKLDLIEEKEKKLSEIIDEINSRLRKSYDNDVAVKAMLQINDILMK